jgi:3-(3-hydroxy-phenyl)propionate hydroxylase
LRGDERDRLEYRRPPELDGTIAERRPVVVIGGGPVGLTAAADLALHGVPVILLDEDDTVSTGSRAICWAKRTLEIFDRLGAGERMLAKGITWNVGKVFHRDDLVYGFNLLPEEGHKFPAFINLQQFYVEQYMIDRSAALPGVELRWRSKVVAIGQDRDSVVLEVETPDGSYAMTADWVLAADGARSTIRRLMGLSFEGKVFEDRFLIADVHMTADFPVERWFWFDPPFHRNQSALLHKQPDDIWRIDLQLGWDADPEEEKRPERVIPRIKAMLGEDVEFELDWVSVYTFQCRRLARFRHDRVIFVGDSAHQVSPFGARGGNSGIQDVDNLAWKLALVIAGKSPPALLDTYDAERSFANDENILHSTCSTEFITPKGPGSKLLRDAVLSLAATHEFARAMVNSGRLSTPCVLPDYGLQTADDAPWGGGLPLGAAMRDAPLRRADGGDAWLLPQFGGDFAILLYDPKEDDLRSLREALHAHPIGARLVAIGPAGSPAAAPFIDHDGLAQARYALHPGAAYLIRPDQHVAGRWHRVDAAAVLRALDRAACLTAGKVEAAA